MAACGEYEGLIAAAVYNQLDATERERLDCHLAGCGECRRELDELSRAARLAGAGTADLSPAERAELAERITRRIGPLKAPPRPPPFSAPVRRRRRFEPAPSPAWAAAAALAAGLLVAGIAGRVFMTRDSGRGARQERTVENEAPPPAPRVGTPETFIPEPPVPPPGGDRKPAPPTPPTLPVPEPPERPSPVPPPPTPERPPEPPPPPRESRTVAVVARLQCLEGRIFIVSEHSRTPAGSPQEIVSGQGILTVGRASFAVVEFPDATRLEIGPDTCVREIAEASPAEVPGSGKRIHLAAGTIAATVPRQPAGRPMVITTPEAETRILGTRLILSSGGGSTRLELEEGKARFTRKSDGASIEVTGGHCAVAAEGTALAARPARVRGGLQVLYLFQEGRGTAVRDVSGAGLPLDLSVRGARAFDWRNPGLVVTSPAVLASTGPALKIVRTCRESREITLEAWIRPRPTAAGSEGCVLGLSRDVQDRNFALVQGDGRDAPGVYAVSLRTSATDKGGRPHLRTPPGQVEERLTHVTYVRYASGMEGLFVNGAERASGRRMGDFSSWDESFRLILGNEATEERPWLGEFRLVAIYSRALRPAEITRNFKLGID